MKPLNKIQLVTVTLTIILVYSLPRIETALDLPHIGSSVVYICILLYLSVQMIKASKWSPALIAAVDRALLTIVPDSIDCTSEKQAKEIRDCWLDRIEAAHRHDNLITTLFSDGSAAIAKVCDGHYDVKTVTKENISPEFLKDLTDGPYG